MIAADYKKLVLEKFSEIEQYHAVKRFIGISEGQKLLDLNFGSDRLLSSLDESGLKLYGIDISENKQERTIDDIALNGMASVTELPYNNDFFDTVTTVGTVGEWLGKSREGFCEILRVLKSGGEFIMTFSKLDPKAIRAEARCSGFAEVKVKILRSDNCYMLIGKKP